MKINRRLCMCVAFAVVVAVVIGCGKVIADRAVVIGNLKAAYNHESNASARYAFFAGKTQEAGYASLAAFFRAVSFAESTHAGSHAKVLAQHGVEAKAVLEPTAWTDIPTAVQEAIKAETCEFVQMYPGFIKTAQEKRMEDAVRSFTHAMKAEKVHAEYYTAALADLNGWKAEGKHFHICGICGFTTTDDSVDICPYCAAPRVRFWQFS